MLVRPLPQLVASLLLSVAPGCTSGGERPTLEETEGALGGAGSEVTTGLQLPFAVTAHYVPTGFMGDGVQGKALLLDTTCSLSTPSTAQGECFRFRYVPTESTLTHWAGLYFQSEPDNWGASPGHRIQPGARRVSFYAAASRPIRVTFVVGGIGSASTVHQDGFKREEALNVGTDFETFSMDLSDLEYDAVLGAFGFVIARKDASFGASKDETVSLYLDGIVWQ